MKNVLGSKVEVLESQAKVTIPMKDYRMLTLMGSEGENLREKIIAGITIAIDTDYQDRPRVVITNSFTSILQDYTLKAVVKYAVSNPDAMAILVTRDEHYFADGCLSAYSYGDTQVVELLDNPIFKAAWDKAVELKKAADNVAEPEVLEGEAE